MAGFVKVIVIGNVGTDPEMRYTAQGTPMTTFRLAATSFYNNAAGERQQETEWFTIVTWRNLAEQCNQYLSKGRQAYVEGRLRSRTWEGANGQTRFRNEIVADRVLFLDRPSPVSAPEEPVAAEPTGESAIQAEDLPFS
ncbi:MAG: single-stranded DNA-binding protein [Chloroflexi bacterium]|nr:single-stranded DNA-binding protein [Chloroflexota bacterium]